MEKITLELQSNLDKIRRTVFREYLYNVSDEFVVYPFDAYNTYKNDKDEETKKIVPDANIQCIHIDRWVYDKKEQIIDRFANVYSTFSQRKDAIAMLVNRTIEGADFYFVIRSDSSQGGNKTNTNSSLDLLMANSEPVNELKHITVLEEAHNLLKKMSTDQSSESSNVQGKSVEMIANAIAEMRTYGEGFVIADQAPGLLDESVIRNTNTKIIMSLPDFLDRELVGKAVGLSDEQVVEITRLPRGKAVVYQNNWVAPVLCAVEAFDKSINPEEKKNVSKEKKYFDSGKIKATIVNAVLHNKVDDISTNEVEGLHILSVPAPSKRRILMHVKNKVPFNKQDRIEIINDFYATDFVKSVMLKTEGNIEIIQDNDVEALKAEFQKWVEAIGVTEQIETVDLMGIINIILYKIEQVEQIELTQCERLFNFAEYWR